MIDEHHLFLQYFLDQKKINEPRFLTDILEPDRTVSFLLKPEDRALREHRITGHRIHHSNLLGPYKGGIAIGSGMDADYFQAMASLMTWKTALLRLPFGGAKGGICTPKGLSLSAEQKRKLMMEYVYAIKDCLGPYQDIPAPDRGTGPKEMYWFRKAFERTGHPLAHHPSCVTGKPHQDHGIEARTPATGYGVYLSAKWAVEARGEKLAGKTYLLEGFGNVGSWAAYYLSQDGAICRGVSDSSANLLFDQAPDIAKLMEFKHQNPLSKASEGTHCERDKWIASQSDLYIPCAKALNLTEKEASNLNCSLVVEGANFPIGFASDRILSERKITVLPDIFANSGGVTASYLEWKRGFADPTEKLDVLQFLEDLMHKAWTKMHQSQSGEGKNYRAAAYSLALDHWLEARQVKETNFETGK